MNFRNFVCAWLDVTSDLLHATSDALHTVADWMERGDE